MVFSFSFKKLNRTNGKMNLGSSGKQPATSKGFGVRVSPTEINETEASEDLSAQLLIFRESNILQMGH